MQHVFPVRHEIRTMPIPRSDVFEFNAHAKYHWLQKLCFRILKRLGCYHSCKKHEVITHRIDTDSFIEKIYEQKKEILNMHYMNGGVLLIGANDYQEMMGSPEIRDVMSFSCQYHYANDGIPSFYGFPVKVIPWMEGMVLVPDNVLNKEVKP